MTNFTGRCPMKAIHEVVGQDLQWIRPKWWKREFELRSGDELLARLYREKGTGCTIGEAADGCWTFKRQGIWKAEIIVTDSASQAAKAVVKGGNTKSVVFSDGRALTWKKTSFWRNEGSWVDSDGTPLIHLLRRQHVALEPCALSLPELSLLAILCWYLTVLQQEEQASIAAGVTAGVTGAVTMGS